tara:strand:+ start:3165 stop:3812 length:648 start_codon:yes stop_codon:yes gene_type:complete
MELVINEDRYYIPKNWNELSLRRYIDFMTTYKEDVSETEKEVHLISTLTGAPQAAITDMKKTDLNKSIDRLKELMLTECSEDLVLSFDIDGVEYGFHPNLSEMKLKEFVDLDNKLQDAWANMHLIMAILYRPITKRKGDKYTIEDYDYVNVDKRSKIFIDELSVSIVNAAASFFLTIAVDYMKITTAYSRLNRQQKRQLTKQMKKSLQKNTVGTA